MLYYNVILCFNVNVIWQVHFTELTYQKIVSHAYEYFNSYLLRLRSWESNFFRKLFSAWPQMYIYGASFKALSPPSPQLKLNWLVSFQMQKV